MRITTLGALRREQALNLERPLKADGRVGGHFVQGHVDAMGTIDEIRTEGDARWFTVAYPPALAPLMVRKGSIAVDGVSLTLAGLGETKFDVMIVPFTWEHTNLRTLRVGDRVNLECDMIGKYVARALELSTT
jgi:riboflavin synthase